MAAAAPGSPLRPWTLYALAFCSGMAALAYQVVWAKMLSLTFGSSTLAASAVVGGFMGGMGIGAWAYHRVYDRAHRALRLYGLLEVGIGLSAGLLTLGLGVLPALFVSVAGWLPTGPLLDVFRIASVFVLLLVPAALMGATYPALCTAVIDSQEAVDRHLGAIYGLNTLGAAAGALLCGLVLVEWLGLRGAAGAGIAVNLAVGATALALARRAPEGAAARPAWSNEEVVETPLSPRLTALVLVGSGFATLCYEIIWFRALRYLFGNSTYALSVMLMVFLVGLGAGALLLRPVLRRFRPERALAYSQLAVALLALAAMALENLVLGQDWLRSQVTIFSAETWYRPWWVRLAIESAVAAAILLPAVIVMGLAFPLASRLYLGSLKQLGARIGGAYLLANVGSIAGAIVAALVLLPALGTIGGTQAVAALNLLLGVVLLTQVDTDRWRVVMVGAFSVCAVVALQRALPERLPFVGWGMEVTEGRLLFEEEGDLATVQVREHPQQPGMRAMTIDGATIGVNGPWQYGTFLKQILLAHLPMALDARVARTLNVGLGSGSTQASLAAYPHVEGIEVVEISGAVVRGAALFPYASVLEDPRVDVVVEDVLHHLLRGDAPYDLIVSDGKQNRSFEGNAKILSREFYEHALARLGERGMLVQWIPLSTTEEDYRIILRTFTEVFPEVEVFYFLETASLLVGSRAPLLDREGLRDADLPAQVRAELQVAGVDNLAQLRGGWVASRDQIQAAVGEGPVNHWNRLALEFNAYRAKPPDWVGAVGDNLALLESASEQPRAGGVPADSPQAASGRLVRRAYLAMTTGDRARAQELTVEALEIDPANGAAARLLEALGAG